MLLTLNKMCGIFALIEDSQNEYHYENIIKISSNLLKHRGPDSTGHKLIMDSSININTLLLHTRLKINGDNTTQPLHNKDKTIYLIINGEIFNWKELGNELNYTCTTSDCEIIIPLYQKYKHNLNILFNKLRGQFSFLLYDLENKHILIGRDHIGVTPLYIGYTNDTCPKYIISSELKCMTCSIFNNTNTTINVFPPRHYLYTPINDINNFKNTITYKDYNDNSFINSTNQTTDTSLTLGHTDISSIHLRLKELLQKSVWSQLEDLIVSNELEFGVLLSGGLDSSIIAACIAELCKKYNYTKKIKTFSIGIHKDVPDLVAARKVAGLLETDHYEYYFSIKEGIENLNNVIWHIESYDCTTVRASTPMFLLSKAIKKNHPNIKVLFSGELSDELLCYLYGANAPSPIHYQQETIDLVNNVHLFDCLRANKTCMAHSLEVRVPFTDYDYVDYILNLDPKWKMFGKNGNMEKQILRDSFKGYLPDDILYRKKEQFSDGVSGFCGKEDNWIDGLKDYTNNSISDSDFNKMCKQYIYNTPDTKEKLYYRNIFSTLFLNTNNTSENTVKQWKPKWCSSDDPSGRIQTFWSKN